MDLTQVLGDFGTVQKRVFVFCIFRTITLVGFLYLLRLYSSIPEHWCAPPAPFSNLTADEWKQCCIPETSKGYSRCDRYQLEDDGIVSNSSVVACNSWNYGPPTDGGYSFVEEWNIVCDRRWHVTLMYTMFSTGGFLTYGPSGYISDKYGRKPCVYLGIVIAMISSFGSAFSTSIYMFTVMQFLAGIGYAFLQHVSLTIFMELSGKRERTYVPIFFNGVWGVAVMIFAGCSIIAPSWRFYLTVLIIPLQIAMLVITITVLPESPRWLLSSKKYSRAEKEIVQLAAINGITVVDEASVMEALKCKIENGRGDSCPTEASSSKGFLRSKRLLAYSAIIFFITISKSFVGAGFNVNLAHMGGHPKLNYVFNGLAGIFSAGLYELCRPLLISRRIILLTCYVITGISFIITALVYNHLHWVKLSIAMTGNIFKKIANSTMYILASELFPTDLRGKGMAAFMISVRFGNILGSFADLFAYKYGQNSIMYLFGGIYFVISFASLILPQTEDNNLPDSVVESKQITKEERR